jgi:hypothetical protein
MKCVPDGAMRIISRSVLQGQKHSPKILFVTGIVGVVATTVVACRATLKLEEVLVSAQKDLDTVRELQHKKYSEEDREQDTAYVYIRSAVKVVKLYLPAVCLGAFSIGCLVGANNILTKRNVALTAAYAAIDRSFGEYRDRVVKELGEDKDREFRYGVREEEKTIVDDNGKKSKDVVKRVGFGPTSGYARFFDEYSRHWDRHPDYNSMFIQCQQNYANDLLRSRGHVFLNDVYDMLGFERTTPGSVVGWIRDGDGDGYIDFGVYNHRNPRARDFVNAREGSVLLDFNVDGVIYDKI